MFTRREQVQWFPGVIFAVIGLGCVLGMMIATHFTLEFLREAVRVEGVVSKLNAGGSHPQVEFELPSGEIHSYAQGGLIGGYETGDRVTVIYRPGDPSSACLDDTGAIWTLVMVLGFFTLSHGLGGLYTMFFES